MDKVPWHGWTQQAIRQKPNKNPHVYEFLLRALFLYSCPAICSDPVGLVASLGEHQHRDPDRIEFQLECLFTDSQLSHPTTYEWNLNLQYEFLPQWVLELG